MSGNPWLWIALASVVIVALVNKGYIKLPSLGTLTQPAAKTALSQPQSNTTYGAATPSESWLLERLDSGTLGVYFALAKRREAEAELAHKIASDAGDAIKATFTAPFSPPAASPGPDQAGVEPPA